MFDETKFNATVFEPRTGKVLVAAMSEFFDVGEKPEFIVRGLTAHEYAAADAAKENDGLISALLAVVAPEKRKSAVSDAREALGLGKEVPAELAKRLEMLVRGIVEPTILRETAVKIAERFPVEFYQLTNEITSLTGKGQQPKK